MLKYAVMVLAVAAAVAVMACSSKKQGDETAEVSKPKALVLYYSQTGTTKVVAEELQRQLDADIESIALVEDYPDGFQETIQRVMQDRAENKEPELVDLKSNVEDYDIVFLGYPIWFGTYAPPISSLLKKCDFAGKKVVPFCSFGSGGLEVSAGDLKAALPKAEIADGYGVRTARVDAVAEELERFLIENGYMDGEIEALPEFSAQEPVTEEDKARFDAACGDYQFPLGTPVTVGKRAVAGGTEYKYEVSSQGANGEDAQTVIYVIASDEADVKPVFTRVVR